MRRFLSVNQRSSLNYRVESRSDSFRHAGHVGRQLKQQQPQFIPEQARGTAEFGDQALDVVLLVPVADQERHIQHIAKILRRLFTPFAISRVLEHAIISRIHFHGIELLCIEFEPTVLCQLRGIEAIFPVLVTPPGRTDANGHGVTPLRKSSHFRNRWRGNSAHLPESY